MFPFIGQFGRPPYIARDRSRNLISEARHLTSVFSFLGKLRWNREAALPTCVLEASSGGPLVAFGMYKSKAHVWCLDCTYLYFSLLSLLELTLTFDTSLLTYAFFLILYLYNSYIFRYGFEEGTIWTSLPQEVCLSFNSPALPLSPLIQLPIVNSPPSSSKHTASHKSQPKKSHSSTKDTAHPSSKQSTGHTNNPSSSSSSNTHYHDTTSSDVVDDMDNLTLDTPYSTVAERDGSTGGGTWSSSASYQTWPEEYGQECELMGVGSQFDSYSGSGSGYSRT